MVADNEIRRLLTEAVEEAAQAGWLESVLRLDQGAVARIVTVMDRWPLSELSKELYVAVRQLRAPGAFPLLVGLLTGLACR